MNLKTFAETINNDAQDIKQIDFPKLTDKPDLICHRHVTWEMIQKEMQKIYNKYIKK